MKLNKVKEATDKKSKLVTHFNPESLISEQFRTLRTNIQFLTENLNKRLFLITSPGKKEGKSTTIVNLAISMAQQKQKVLLIDTNLRNPTVHQLFKTDNHEGLTDVLTGRSTLKNVVQPAGFGSLHIITTGKPSANPSELLGSDIMVQVLSKVSQDYDIVLIDAPSVLQSNEARVLANMCDGVVLVVNRGNTDLRKVMEAKKVLDIVHANIVGAIMNEKGRKIF
ncbi:CpsD/CapB family tyrosine-protein kinase [Halobacillus campisalis]|uniref:non-specific protein-tyrosine kinase n=1 Tax=Halobacillus campisalis TaxID=435909 RepID=A0ABW2K9K5_9BACI|nr:CpsD/CapB family tyrosine-protein kinase [Halobacillus campisalis]